MASKRCALCLRCDGSGVSAGWILGAVRGLSVSERDAVKGLAQVAVVERGK